MRFEDWLDAERGRLTRVAAHFQVSPSAVSQWRANGVPVDSMVALHEFTGKEVSLAELLSRPPKKTEEEPQPPAPPKRPERRIRPDDRRADPPDCDCNDHDPAPQKAA